jgi:hypothetical protein
MAKTQDGLKVLAPQPVPDERSPLLGQPNETASDHDDTLEAQAHREQREYDAGATPIADEPSTRTLVLTMASLWMSTFFAALGIPFASPMSKTSAYITQMQQL